MGRIVAIANQKGGVGKTTTAVNLAAALAVAERRTLLVDSDPQSNTTRALGFDPDPSRPSVYEGLVGGASLAELTLTYSGLEALRLIPSSRDLVGIEIELVEEPQREFRMRSLLEAARGQYDHILIDCPPSLGLITLNALVAADAVLVPVQAEFLALEGISQLMETISQVRSVLNPQLAIHGVVLTMFDDRTNLARAVVEEVRKVFGEQVYRTVIPRNVRLSEAPSHGQPIFLYDIRSKGADAYLNLAKEFVDHEEKGLGPRAEQSDSASQDSGADARTERGSQPHPAVDRGHEVEHPAD